jgi:hypothetical protein
VKRSCGPRKTADLSESVHQQLNMYTLAAGAAGVSLLCLTPPCDAKTIYTPGPRGNRTRRNKFDLHRSQSRRHI